VRSDRRHIHDEDRVGDSAGRREDGDGWMIMWFLFSNATSTSLTNSSDSLLSRLQARNSIVEVVLGQ
jgi:hypothetical protein